MTTRARLLAILKEPFKAVQYVLMAALALVVLWNVHPFLAGIGVTLLAKAVVDYITLGEDNEHS